MRSLCLGLIAALAVSVFTTQDALAKTDEAMAQQIAGELKESGQLKDYRVGVKYKDGVAWLMGTVSSEEQKQIAEQITNGSQDVVHVVSKLEVAVAEKAQPKKDLQVAPASTPAETPVSPPARQARLTRPVARRAPARGNMPVPYARMGQGVRSAAYCPGGNCAPNGAMGPGAMGPGAMGPGAMGSGAMRPGPMGPGAMGPGAMGHVPVATGQSVSYDNPQVPNYAWPSYAASPNYAALTYPKQYSASAWPYIGPFYPYPQVPLGWRKVTLEWDDGWWFLDFKDCKHCK